MTEKLSIDQVLLQKLLAIIETHLENEKFGVAELATEIGLSRSQLHRRLQDINGKSTSQFIREYRLEKGMEMLKLNQATASEIAYRVGFSSPTYFNTCFNNFYGYPPGEVKYQNAITPPKKTFSKKLISVVPVIILVGLIIFSKVFNKKTVETENIEKTIAVLPFVNNSANEENMYFCNGIMAGIRDHLAKIPEFSLASRLSVEQYRNTTSSLKAIAKELDVNYVVEGHVQRVANRAIISAELIRVEDNKVIWSDRYDKDVSEIFEVQANVIKSITNNLETIISPNLKIQLSNIPTQDTLAYDHYLKGEEFRFKAKYALQKTEDWLELLNKANLSYELAIERDSLFAQAYVGLALSIWERSGRYMLEENNLDMVLVYLNKAIQINSMLTEAFVIRGEYYLRTKQNDKAKTDFETALILDQNNVPALIDLMRLYRREQNYKDALITFKKTEKHLDTQADSLRVYGGYQFYYALLDDYKMEQYYLDKIAEIRSGFSNTQVWLYNRTQQWEKAIDHIEKYWSQKNQQTNVWLAAHYLYMPEKNKETLKYYGDWHKQVMAEGVSCWVSSRSYHRYGYALIRDGQIEKGLDMVKKQIEMFNQLVNLDRADQWVYYDLAGAYTLLGQYEKAYENMDKFEQLNGWTMWGGMVAMVKYDVQFDVLRDDPRFQEWVRSGEIQLEAVQKQIRPYLPSTPSIKTD